MRARRLLSLALASAAITVLAAGAGQAQTAPKAPTQTQGQAQAVIARIVPYVGLPGVTTSVGLAGAQVQGGTAQATAAAADFGLLGALATAGASGSGVPGLPAPELPTPISADSGGTTSVERDPFASAAPEGAPATPAEAPGFLAHESVTATADPLLARGVVEGPTLSIPGLLEMSGGRSSAVSEATGSVSDVTIGRLALGGEQVVLSGLRWTATQAGKAAGASGFELGGLAVAGQAFPLDGPAELAAALAAANTSLAPYGLFLSAPARTGDDAGATVAPLVIQVRNPEPLVEPSRQATESVRPVLTPLVESLIAAYPDAATAQIVVNALVGGAGGSSGGRLELGGVSARTAQVLDDVAGPLGGGDAAGAVPAVPGVPGAPGGGQVPRADAGADDGSVSPAIPAGLDGLPATDPPGGAVPADAGAITAGPTDVVPSALSSGTPEGTDRGLTILALGLALAAVAVLAVGDRVRLARAAK